ncbi:mitochondrial fission process protein 1 [Musca vetustissima]|uniref:mitochondrial fission process protein 1 n=1 Tax=Musca vetustissima TaxID=27455 RepID=UPI002AB71C60|nr:mitochondrial fission process protein 1 [Musca vetustissima]
MEKEKDLYRETWVRYLGYCNEVGEAFRRLVPSKLVTASYVVSTGYVCADTIDKSYKDYKQGASVKNVAITATDVFIWQILASVVIPGFTINRITYLSGRLLRQANVKKAIAKYLPTAFGLTSIPFIIPPIDHSVDYLMDNTYRKFVTKAT